MALPYLSSPFGALNIQTAPGRQSVPEGQRDTETFQGDEGPLPPGTKPTSDAFNLDRFESLLSRLEASKGRQQRQKSVEGRRDIYAKCLAGMMSNF